MRIAAAVKQVPASDGAATDMERGFLIRSGRGRLNPYDGPAVEAALRLRDLSGGQADIFSMGPESAAEAVTEALNMGADKGFLMTDKAFAGADSLVTARTLAEGFAACGPYDLYVFGQKSTDGDTGQVGPSVASFLGLPFVGRVTDFVKIESCDLVARQIVGEAIQVVLLSFPAVISVLRESFVPRLPSLKMKMRKKNLARLQLGDLSLQDTLLFGSKGSPTKIRRVYYPEQPPRGKAVVVSPGEAAERILAAIEARHERKQ